MATREDIVRVARTYIGTPYAQRGRLPGVVLDCVGVPVCVCRDLGIRPPDFDVEPYSSQPDGRTFLIECDKYMKRVNALEVGGVLVFSIHKFPQHIGILGDYKYGGFSVIHANQKADPPRVIETRLMFAKNLKFVQAYVLPIG